MYLLRIVDVRAIPLYLDQLYLSLSFSPPISSATRRRRLTRPAYSSAFSTGFNTSR